MKPVFKHFILKDVYYGWIRSIVTDGLIRDLAEAIMMLVAGLLLLVLRIVCLVTFPLAAAIFTYSDYRDYRKDVARLKAYEEVNPHE